MIERIEKLMLSNSNEDRQIAVQLLRSCSHQEILYLLPNIYAPTPWNYKKEQLECGIEYRQENAFYYKLEHGYLCYNGFIWYSPKEINSPPSSLHYKLIEDE